jgi:anthranilate phosphoribosyltransferase
MAQPNDHIAHLEKLRDRLREERRKLAKTLAGTVLRATGRLTTMQQALEAVERALQDERAAEKEEGQLRALEAAKKPRPTERWTNEEPPDLT